MAKARTAQAAPPPEGLDKAPPAAAQGGKAPANAAAAAAAEDGGFAADWSELSPSKLKDRAAGARRPAPMRTAENCAP